MGSRQREEPALVLYHRVRTVFIGWGNSTGYLHRDDTKHNHSVNMKQICNTECQAENDTEKTIPLDATRVSTTSASMS